MNVVSQEMFYGMKGERQPVDESQITPPGPPIKTTIGPPSVTASDDLKGEYDTVEINQQKRCALLSFSRP